MAHDGDPRMTGARGLSERMVLRSPHLTLHKRKKPHLHVGKLKLDTTFLARRASVSSAKGLPSPTTPPPTFPRKREYGTVDYEGQILGFSMSLPGGPLPMRQAGPHSIALPTGYEYLQDRVLTWMPGLAQELSEAAMFELQKEPNRFFPFQVLGHQGETEILLGHVYDLTNRSLLPFPLPPGRFPVMVTQVTATSFTFTTLPGHFDPPGSTITFTTWADSSGSVHLEHRGVTTRGDASPSYIVAPTLAGEAWDLQAARLRNWLSAGR